ncbi:MAG: hypothetical protein ABEH64_05275 [Salinirussus sp.]
MNPWAWIAAYVVGFALLQLLLVRYLGDGGGIISTPAGDGGSSQQRTDREATPDAITCPACGAVNEPDQGYSFCRECVEPLS